MTRGTHSTVEQAPGVGDAIGRYRIIGVLGDGRLGRLCVAEQRGIRGISKTVALRCIRPELARNPRFRTAFSEAANIATRCEHPNLLTVFEMTSIDGRYFISMEYLPGESVTSLIHQCSARDDLSPDIAAYLVRQVGSAVQYLRDLRQASPQRVSSCRIEVDTSNVFVSYHGTVKWLGFGLRSLAEGLAPLAGEAAPAPSDTLADGTAPDADADRYAQVFNLGALLWTCLVGEQSRLTPAHPQAAVAASNAAIHAKPSQILPSQILPSQILPAQILPAPSSIRADVPEALDAIVKQALSSDSREQFQSPHDLSDALDRYLFRRESRPTPRHLRRWMEQLFGAERAALQMQIARGRDAEAALSRLGALPHAGAPTSGARSFSVPRPRALWSTSHSVFSQLSRASLAPRSFERIPGSGPDEGSHITSILMRHGRPSFVSVPSSLASTELPPLQVPQGRPSRTWLVMTLAAAGIVLAAGLLLITVTTSPNGFVAPDSGSVQGSGRVDVHSRPEGAAVFVDGEPTGLHTPAVLKGLAHGRTLHVRVEMAGFTSSEQRVPIVGGAVETRVFELSPSDARVHFEGAPPDARIYVDDVLLAGGGDLPVNLPLGSHLVRVETAGGLVFSGWMDIVAGEQTLHVGAGRANP